MQVNPNNLEPRLRLKILMSYVIFRYVDVKSISCIIQTSGKNTTQLKNKTVGAIKFNHTVPSRRGCPSYFNGFGWDKIDFMDPDLSFIKKPLIFF